MQKSIIKINQDLTGNNDKNKEFYIGNIMFSELNKIIISENERTYEESGFVSGIQRLLDTKRINHILEYLSEDLDIPFFITPLIYGFQSDDFNKIEGDKIILKGDYIESGLIVDGQHRFFGMKKKWEDNNNFDIEIPIVFLVDYDKFQLSKIFANINFKQKPVNKSLYYDLFGSDYSEYNELTFAHNMVHELNFRKDSSLKGNIIMLGKKRNNNEFISQAFLVEKILKYLLNNKNIKEDIKDLLKKYSDKAEKIKKTSDYKEKELEDIKKDFIESKEFTKYYNLLNYYFKFVNEEFGNIDKTKSTIGYGAFFRLLKDFIENEKNFIDNYENNLGNIDKDILEKIKNKIQNISGSSESSQSELYKEISGLIFKEKKANAKETLYKEIIKKYDVGNEFSLIEVYKNVLPVLEKIFPNNFNLPAKTRQLLQILRDEGYIKFLGKGKYKLIKK